MQVQRVQFNNPCITFKSDNKIKYLQIDNKNPLITDEVRSVANNLHQFFKSVEGKTFTIDGISVGSPVRTSLDVTLNDSTVDQKKIKLVLYKNSEDAEQISRAEISIPEKSVPENTNQKQVIEYYPRRQIRGNCMDDLVSCRIKKSIYGVTSNYNRTPELNDIFVKYAKEFLVKLEKLIKYYK